MQFHYQRINETRLFDRAAKLRKLLQDYVHNIKEQNRYWKYFNWENFHHRFRRIDWSPFRKPRFIVAATTATLFLVVSGGYIQWNVYHTGSWSEVFSNGTYIGMVPNDPITVSTIQRTADAYSVPLNMVPVHQQIPSNYDWRSVTQLPQQAYAVTLNGKPLVYTSTSQAAHSVLTNIKQSLTPKALSTNAKVHFSGVVDVQQAVVGVANILSVEAAVKYILHPSQISIVGRSASPLLKDNASSLTPNAFPSGPLKASSQSTSGQAGESRNSGPLLTVITSDVVKKKIKVNFSLKKIKDRHLGAGKIKVAQKGVSGINQETLQVTYKNGKPVSEKILSRVKVRPVQDEIELEGVNYYGAIMSTALKYEGYPYFYGGSTPQTSFDCSGLVQWVFRKEGISLPRTAQEQWNATEHVSESQAKPGDLVFFSGTYDDPGNIVTHVGIYVGNGMMYDAGNSGVGYHALSGYMRQHLYGFGRVRH